MQPETWACLLAFTSALVVYFNTWDAAFAFDDNFAILYNGDVTNDNNPLRGLFLNDFW